MIATLFLENIRLDGGTQSRKTLNEEVIADYAEAYLSSTSMPMASVIFDGTDYWLWDGFHRYHGAKRAKKKTLDCTVQNGTLEDARWLAFGANRTHGLRRSNDDKRMATEGALRKHPSMTDRSIALHVGVSHTFVSTIRLALATLPPDNAPSGEEEPASSETRTGRDGRQYREDRGRTEEQKIALALKVTDQFLESLKPVGLYERFKDDLALVRADIVSMGEGGSGMTDENIPAAELRKLFNEACVLIGMVARSLGISEENGYTGNLLQSCNQIAKELRSAREELPRLRKEVAELRRLLIREESV